MFLAFKLQYRGSIQRTSRSKRRVFSQLLVVGGDDYRKPWLTIHAARVGYCSAARPNALQSRKKISVCIDWSVLSGRDSRAQPREQ